MPHVCFVTVKEIHMDILIHIEERPGRFRIEYKTAPHADDTPSVTKLGTRLFRHIELVVPIFRLGLRGWFGHLALRRGLRRL